MAQTLPFTQPSYRDQTIGHTHLGGGGSMPPEAEARWNSVIPLGT